MKNTMAKIMYAFITLFLFIVSSCKETNQRLEYALDFAGSNRVELEKVLDYYKGDSLKLKASYFLIENMPRYFSYTGHVLDSIKAIKASDNMRIVNLRKVAIIKAFQRVYLIIR